MAWVIPDDVLVEKVKNKPPTWFLTKYQVNANGPLSRVNGLLIKQTARNHWLLEVHGTGAYFKSKRKAVSVFNETAFEVNNEDNKRSNL